VCLVPGQQSARACLRDLDRVAATRLAFFLAIPALVAAGAYEAIKEASVISTGVGCLPTVLATGVSFVVGDASIAWLLRFRGQAQHHGVHLVSRGTGGGHRGAARYRDAEPDVDTIEHSANASPCRLSAAKADRRKLTLAPPIPRCAGRLGEPYPGPRENGA
jgi:hypothetical protein